LTGLENVRCLAAYSGAVAAGAACEALAFVGLAERMHDRVATYSRGMRQRLALAQALVPAPDLVLLDEPAEGLDPEGAATFHALVPRLARERGIAVAIASHQLAEIEPVCDRVLVLDAGRLVFSGAPTGVEPPARMVRFRVDDWSRAEIALRATGARCVGDGIVALSGRLDAGDLVAALVAAEVKVHAVEPLRRSLADLYQDVLRAARSRS
jgi:ABC-2 type transport system ATP-binding protein